MKASVRFFSFLLALLLIAGAAAADDKPDFREIPASAAEDVPDMIQRVLDLAYDEWLATDGANLKESNKYTKWRNNGNWGWCGGFITYCMLDPDRAMDIEIPMQEVNKTPKEEVPGLVHVKEAGVGKLHKGYLNMNRVTRIPRKGFIAVFGNGKSFEGVGVTAYYHVGLVYDVEALPDGKYRITTIEGNVTSPGDDSHKKAGHTVRMYIRDYDPNAEKPQLDLSLVPEGERTREESALFSYKYTYNNEGLYIYDFLMPWIPRETAEP